MSDEVNHLNHCKIHVSRIEHYTQQSIKFRLCTGLVVLLVMNYFETLGFGVFLKEFSVKKKATDERPFAIRGQNRP